MRIEDIKQQLEFIEPINLQYLLTLEPKEIIKWFEDKKIVLSQSWRETLLRMQKNVFTISGVARLDMLNDVYKLVLEAIKEGKTAGQFKQEIKEKLVMRGYLSDNLDETAGILLTPWRMNLVYRQNLQTGFMSGRYKAQLANAKYRPYWQYIGILDNNTRPVHAELQRYFADKVLRFDHPFWNTYYPPNDFNCRCRVKALSESEIKSQGLTIIRRMNTKQFPIGKGFNHPPDVEFTPDFTKYENPVKKVALEIFE